MNKRAISNLIALALAFVLTFETSFLHAKNLSYTYTYNAGLKSVEKSSSVKPSSGEASYSSGSRSASPLVLRPQWSNPSQVELVASRNVATAEVLGEQGQIILTATVKDASGQPMPGVYVTWQLDKALVVDPASGYTDASGNISAVVSSVEAVSSSVKLRVAGSVYEFDTGQQIAFERPEYQVIAGDLLISTNTSITSNLLIQGDLIIQNATVLITGQRVIQAENIVVDAGAWLNADGTGHGAGRGGSPGEPKQESATGGGGHGSHGGEGDLYPPDQDPAWPGTAYGSIAKPERLGSSGGVRNGDTSCPGVGGGAIKLIATGVFTHDGLISANGTNAAPNSACGGGSGGSIWISATHLYGSGSIQANGGDGSTLIYNNVELRGGGGSGGRVAIYGIYDSYQPLGFDIQVRRGENGKYAADDGTKLHVLPVDESTSSLRANNNVGYVDVPNGLTLTVHLVMPGGRPVISRPVRMQVQTTDGGVWLNEHEAGWWNGGIVRVGETDAQGYLTVSMRSVVTGALDISAFTVDGIEISPTLSVTFVAGPASQMEWDITSASSVSVGEQITLVGILRDSQGRPVSDHIVGLTSNSSRLQVSPSITRSDTEGRFIAVLSASRAGQYVVTATVTNLDGSYLESNVAINFTRENTPTEAISVVWISAPATTTLGQVATVVGRVVDTEGQGVSGGAVSLSFAASTLDDLTASLGNDQTDENGLFTVTLTSSVETAYVLTASVSISADEVVARHEGMFLRFLSQVGWEIQPSPVVIVGEQITLTGKVEDPEGVGLNNREVVVAVSSEALQAQLIQPVTDQEGYFAVVLSAQLAGQYIVTATVTNLDGSQLSSSVPITFESFDFGTAQWELPQDLEMGQGDSVVITVTLLKPGGEPLANKPVHFSSCTILPDKPCSENGIQLGAGSRASDAAGRVTATLVTSSGVSGVSNLSVRVTTPGELFELQSPAFTLRPALPSASHTTLQVPEYISATNLSRYSLVNVPYVLVVRDKNARAIADRLILINGWQQQRTDAGGEVQGTISCNPQASSDLCIVVAQVGDGSSVFRPALTITRTVTLRWRVASAATSQPLSSALADGQQAIRITVQLTSTDITGVLFPARWRTVSLVAGGCCQTLNVSPITATTNVTGTAEFFVRSTAALSRPTFIITTDEFTRAVTLEATFVDPTVNGVSIALSEVTGTVRVMPADRATSNRYDVVLRDVQGQPALHREVSLIVEPHPDTGTGRWIIPGGITRLPFNAAPFWVGGIARPGVYTLTAILQEVGSSAPITVQQGLTLTFTPVADSARSRLVADQAVAQTGQEVTITASLTDLAGLPMPGVLVQLARVSGNAAVITTPALAETDAQGQVSFVVRAQTTGQNTFQVRYRHPLEAAWREMTQTIRITFVTATVDARRSDLVAAAAITIADGSAQITVTALLRDLFGNPVSEAHSVVFSHSGTDVLSDPPSGIVTATGGVASIRYRSTTPQALVVQASLPGQGITLSTQVSISFAAHGTPDATRSTLVADRATSFASAGHPIVVTATLRDAQGRLLPFREVSLTAVGQIAPVTVQRRSSSAVTDLSGQMAWDVWSTVSQSVTIRAQDVSSGVDLSPTLVVSFVSGPPSPFNTSHTMVGGWHSRDATVTFVLRDSADRLLPGYPVELVVQPTGQTTNTLRVTPALAQLSDNQGRVTFTLSALSMGSWTLRLRDQMRGTLGFPVDQGSIPLSPLQLVFYGEPSAAASVLEASTSKALAYGRETVAVTARVRDARGAALPGIAVSFVVSPSTGVTLTQISTRTNERGDVEAYLQADRPIAVTVSAMLLNGQILKSTSVEFYAPAIWLPASQVAISPSAAVADGTQPIVVTATLRDLRGAPLVNRQIRLVATGSNNAFPSGQVRTTNSQGEVQLALTSTRAERKHLQLEDVQSGLRLNIGHADFRAALPAPAQSGVLVNRLAAHANGSDSIRVTVLLRDQNQNPVPNHSVLVEANGVVTGTGMGSTGLDGIFIAELRSSVAQKVTLTVSTATESGLTPIGRLSLEFWETASPDWTVMTVSPQRVTVGGDAARVTVELRSNTGAPLSGRRILLTPRVTETSILLDSGVVISPSAEVRTDLQGRAVFEVSSMRAATRYLEVIDVESGSVIARSPIQFVANLFSASTSDLVVPEARYWSAGEVVLAEVFVRDHLSNPMMDRVVRVELFGDGIEVTSRQAQAIAGGYAVTLTTDAQGNAVIGFQTAIPQKVLLRAWDVETGERIGQQEVWFVGSPDAGRSRIYVYSGTVAANGQDLVQVEADVRDADGRPVAGLPVKLTLGKLPYQSYQVLPDRVITTSPTGQAVFYVSTQRAGTHVVRLESVAASPDGPARLLGSTVVTFTSNLPDPARSSILVAPQTTLPADGVTPYDVIVTVRDVHGNPVPGASVSLQVEPAQGVAIVQPNGGTDSAGRAIGQIRSTSQATLTVSARVNGIPLPTTEQVRFGGAQLQLVLLPPARVQVGQPAQFGLLVANTGVLAAYGVSLQAAISPTHFVFSTTLSEGFTFTQTDGLLRWSTQELPAGDERLILFTAQTDLLSVGEQVSVTASVADSSGGVPSAVYTTAVTPPVAHIAEFVEPSRVIGTGFANQVTYTLAVTNVGVFSDTYEVIVRLPIASLAVMSPAQPLSASATAQQFLVTSSLTLQPGEGVLLPIGLAFEACAVAGTYAVEAHVLSYRDSSANQSARADLQVLPTPDFLAVTPASVSRAARGMSVFSWNTHSADAVGQLTLVQTQGSSVGASYPSEVTSLGNGLFRHTVVVSGLEEGKTYAWTARLASQCGMSETMPGVLYVDRAVAFQSNHFAQQIERDYNQRVVLRIVNRDSEPRLVVASVSSLDNNDDLVFGFVGDGSTDRVVEVRPGEVRELELMAHAQNARARSYALLARLRSAEGGSQQQTALVALEGESGELFNAAAAAGVAEDVALIHLSVREPRVNYVLEEISVDPVSAVRVYRVVNLGDPLTELTVRVRPISGTGDFYLYPSIEHARLDRGQAITFEVVPRPERGGFNGLEGEIEVTHLRGKAVSSESIRRRIKLELPPGKQVFIGRVQPASSSMAASFAPQSFAHASGVDREYVTVLGESAGWYCTNKPDIDYVIPVALRGGTPSRTTLSMDFIPGSEALPHQVSVWLDTVPVAQLYGVPKGRYEWMLSPAYFGPQGVAWRSSDVHVVSLRTRHMNEGHYIVHTGAVLKACFTNYEEPVIASSQEEANAIVSNRSYVAQSAGGQLRIVQPERGVLVWSDQPIKVRAVLHGGEASGRVYLRTSLGQVAMAQVMPGVYEAEWAPPRPQAPAGYQLLVTGEECGIKSDMKLVTLLLPDEEPEDEDDESPPARGSYFTIRPAVVPPDGRTPAFITLTLRSMEDNSVLPNTQVMIFNEPAYWQTTPQKGEILSAVGTTDANGQFATQVTSTVPGLIYVKAYDITNQREVPAVGLVSFNAVGSLRVKPNYIRANGSDEATITVKLGTPLPSDAVVQLVSSRGDVDTISPVSAVDGSNSTFTAKVTSRTPGNSKITAFVTYGTGPNAVSDRVGSPATVRFYDNRIPTDLEVSPLVTYTWSPDVPHQVAVTLTFRGARARSSGLEVNLTTSRPLSDRVSTSGVTDEQGVYRATIASSYPGESVLLLRYQDPDMEQEVSLSEKVRFVAALGSVSVTVSPSPPIQFPNTPVVLTATVMDDKGRPAADRLFMLYVHEREGRGDPGFTPVVTTNAAGEFRVEYQAVRDETVSMRLYEVLGRPEDSVYPSKRHNWGALNVAPVLFVAERPMRLSLSSDFLNAGTPLTAVATAVVGTPPYVNYPSSNTPITVQVQSSSAVLGQAVITTDRKGEVKFVFTPTQEGNHVVELLNPATGKVAASAEFFVKPSDSTCEGRPEILSYLTNYRLGRDVFYPPRLGAGGMLSAQLRVDWMGCQPGKLVVSVSSLPGFVKEYPITADTLTGAREITHVITDVLDVFDLPPGTNVIQVRAVSTDALRSTPLELTHVAQGDFKTFLWSFLSSRGIPLDTLDLFRFDAVLGSGHVTMVRHPVRKVSVRGLNYSIIFPHPSDQQVSGLWYRIKDAFASRGENGNPGQGNPGQGDPGQGDPGQGKPGQGGPKKRDAKVKLTEKLKGKSVNLLNLAVPFVCDAGPYVSAVMLRFVNWKVHEVTPKSEELKQWARENLGKLSNVTEKYITRVTKEGKDEIDRHDVKLTLAFKLTLGFGLPPIFCDFYRLDHSSVSSLESLLSGMTLGPIRLGMEAQVMWTWSLVPVLLRLVPGVGAVAAGIFEFVCNALGVKGVCGPEIYFTLGAGLGLGPYLYNIYKDGVFGLHPHPSKPPGFSAAIKVLAGLEWALGRFLYVNAEAAGALKMSYLFGWDNGSTSPFPTRACPDKLVLEGEFFFKAVLLDLWMTEYYAAPEGELFRADESLRQPCLQGGSGTTAPPDTELDDEDFEYFADNMDFTVDNEEADGFLPDYGHGASGALHSQASDATGDASPLNAPDILLSSAFNGAMSAVFGDDQMTPALSLQPQNNFKLIRSIGSGDPTYAIFAERSQVETAFSYQAPLFPSASAAAATTISSVLVSNVFTYTSVALAHEPNGTRSILVWSHDDPNRPLGGSRELLYSIWNGSSWSQPRALTQDSVSDLHPSVIWDTTGRVTLAWIRAKQQLTDTFNLSPFEIAVSSYNPNTDQWARTVLLTQNNHADLAPRLLHDGQGRVMIVWREVNSALGSRLLSRQLNSDGTWSAVEVAMDRSVLAFDAAYHGGEAVLVGTVPVTGGPGRAATYQVFASRRLSNTWQMPVRVSTDDSVNHRSASVVYDADGRAVVGWVADGRVMLRTLEGNLATELTSQWLSALAQDVSEFRLLRSPRGDLAVVLRDSRKPASLRFASLDVQSRQLGLLGAPILVSDPPTESVLSLDVGFDSSGRLLAGYVRVVNDVVTQTRFVTQLVAEGGGMFMPSASRVVTREEVIERLVPRQADLVTLAHLPGRDMRVLASVEDTIAVSSSLFVSVAAQARNVGDFVENANGRDLVLAFYVGDPDAGGRLVQSVAITQAIPPGGWAEWSHRFVLSPTKQVTLAVRLVHQSGDPRPANNTTLIPLTFEFAPRVHSLESISLTETASGTRAMLFGFGLTSSGFVTATASVMTVTLSQAEPIAVRAIAVPPIPPQSMEVLTVELPLAGLRSGQYTLTAELQGVERRFVSVQKTPGDLAIEKVQWTDLSSAPVVLNVQVRNNSWLTATDVALLVTDGSFNGSPFLGGGRTESLGDLSPQETVTVTIVLTRPQLCRLDLQVASLSMNETNTGNNAVSVLNNRLCFQVALDIERVETPTSTLLASSGVLTNLTVTRTSEGVAPMTVRVSATTGLTNGQWLWKFGDGVTDTRQSPGLHTYTRAGGYLVEVEVTDPESGAKAHASSYVIVYSPTVPLIGCDGCDSARVGQTIVLTDASEGQIEDVRWNLGDGSVTRTGGLVEHVYGAPGVYTVTLSVKGFEGDWRTVTRTVTVAGTPSYQVYLPRVALSSAQPLSERRVYLPVVRRQPGSARR